MNHISDKNTDYTKQIVPSFTNSPHKYRPIESIKRIKMYMSNFAFLNNFQQVRLKSTYGHNKCQVF